MQCQNEAAVPAVCGGLGRGLAQGGATHAGAGKSSLRAAGRSLVPDEIPLVNRERRDAIARTHMNAPNHRALAVAKGVA